MSANNLRPAGEVLLEMEPLLFELVQDHEIQKGELLALISAWVDIHYAGAIEEYEDDTHPIFFYGSPEQLRKIADKI